MAADKRMRPVLIGLVLALLAPIAALAADGEGADESLTPIAVSFVQTLAKQSFDAAETNFAAPMKQAAPPEKLRDIWQRLLSQSGAFQDTGGSKTIVQGGLTTVIVRTDFKNRSVGIAVTFDAAHQIAGMHITPAPPP